MEYPTVKSAHEELINRLTSITRIGVSLTPDPGGPGDVRILDYMARDNLLVQATPVEMGANENATTTLLKHIDAWLLTDWPHKLAGGTQSPATLEVRIATSDRKVHTAAPLKFSIDVSGPGGPWEPENLSHRVTAEPGRIARHGDGYLFYGFTPAMADIGAEVVGPEGSRGRGSATVHVVKP